MDVAVVVFWRASGGAATWMSRPALAKDGGQRWELVGNQSDTCSCLRISILLFLRKSNKSINTIVKFII